MRVRAKHAIANTFTFFGESFHDFFDWLGGFASFRQIRIGGASFLGKIKRCELEAASMETRG
jgi:hypothetical protein